MAKGNCRSPSSLQKQFQAGIRDLSDSRHIWELFSDFVEASAISLAQSIYQDPELEKQYMAIVEKLGPEPIRKMPALLAMLVDAFTEGPQDFLGEAFMQLDLGSHWAGQFFTPYNLSLMSAKMTLGDTKPDSVITVCEPACGAGGMVIAMADAMLENKWNPQECMHVVAQDISPVCFYMTYIQLSLLGISAEVVLGNTLALETRKVWRTPMSVIRGYTMESITRVKELRNAGNALFGQEVETVEVESQDVDPLEVPGVTPEEVTVVLPAISPGQASLDLFF